MQLKPTVLAYFRVMAAQMVGRIQPPPVSPLAEATAPLGLPEPAAATAARAAADGQPARPGRMSAAAPRVGVVGGGVLGISLALRLAQAGAEVTVVERGPSLGGLAGTMDFGGHEVDRFYHVITPADQRMIAMAEEVGLGDQLRFSPVGAGFFANGEMHDFNGVGDLLRFSPLSPPARLRLGWFVAQCQLRSSYEKLDEIPLETWLRRICGKRGRGADLEAAARLALRRRPLGAAGDLPLGPDPADVRRARARAAAARRWATSSAATSA